jgi:chromosome partitioning protein
MTTVTIMNMKGGVGKTTITMHLGGIMSLYQFAGKRRKVLLIDYDPQFNLSQAFIPAKIYFELEKKRKTILSVLQDDETALNPFFLQVPGNENPPLVTDIAYKIYTRNGCCLDIIPSTLDLMYIALGQSEKRTKPIEERFTKFITQCQTIYDLVLIDCHPAGSIFTKTALQNSDHLIIPVTSQPYAERGVALMMKFIEAKKLGITPQPHILFNLTSPSKDSSAEAIIRKNPRFANKCMTASLKEYRIFSEPLAGQGFVWDSNKPYSTQALKNLTEVAEEFIQKVKI